MSELNPETLQAMKDAAAKAGNHRWVESALAIAYIIDIDNAHAVVASVVEYNADGTVYLEFENATNHQKFIAVCNPANVSALIAECERLKGALQLLVTDVQEYEAWQRPCHALDVARAALGKEK